MLLKYFNIEKFRQFVFVFKLKNLLGMKDQAKCILHAIK